MLVVINVCRKLHWHIQKPKLPKLYVRVETSTSYFIIHNQFVK